MEERMTVALEKRMAMRGERVHAAFMRRIGRNVHCSSVSLLRVSDDRASANAIAMSRGCNVQDLPLSHTQRGMRGSGMWPVHRPGVLS